MDTQTITKASNKVITDAMEAVKSHPRMAALVGLGVSWLITDNMLRQKTASEKMIDQLQEEIEQLQEKVEQYAESKLSDLTESAKETGEAIIQKSEAALEEVSGYMDKNPLAAGFIGISAGLIIGILTSRLLKQEGLLEETGQAVQKKTRQIMSETKEKAWELIDAATKAARKEAERPNIH